MKTWKKNTLKVLCAITATLCALGMMACNVKEVLQQEEKATGISTVAQLKSITNGSYALENDIDLQGEEWLPLASFSGKLDGKGHKIHNFRLKQEQDNVGFIAENSGTLRNIVFENVTLIERSEKSTAGIVVGKNTGVVEGCIVNGEIDASYCKWVGGVAGYNTQKGVIRNCTNNAIINAGDIVGGVVGYSQGSLQDCINNALIAGKKCVGGIAGVTNGLCQDVENTANITARAGECGGIIGAVESSGTLKRLYNSGKVIGEDSYTGGIIGRMWSGNAVEAVENTGEVKGTEIVGGIIGSCEVAIKIVGLENVSPVAGTYRVGGIVGWAQDGCVLTGCKNLGAIEGKCYQGGLVGGGSSTIVDGENTGLLVHTEGKIIDQVLYSYFGGIAGECKELENCKNVATVVGVGEYVGGIAGVTRDAVDCENTVYVKGVNQVGGIAGKGNNASNVVNSGKVEGTSNVGGIYGTVIGAYKIEASVNEGEIKGSDNVAGIIGKALDGVTLIGNENKGIVTGMGYVGGVLGYSKVATVTGNINSGSITAEIKVGGIVGYGFYPTIKYCENKGIINADNEVGGILGEADGNVYLINYKYNEKQLVSVSDCKNSGIVKGNAHVGGIFGRLTMRMSSASNSETVDATLDKLVNTGNVTGYTSVGGIGGFMDGVRGEYSYNYKKKTVTVYYHLQNSTNSATVSGNSELGGLVGELGNYAIVEDSCTDTGTVKELNQNT